MIVKAANGMTHGHGYVVTEKVKIAVIIPMMAANIMRKKRRNE